MKKGIIRVTVIVGLVLSAAAVANQTLDGFNWSGSDFVFMGFLLAIPGFLFEFVSRQSTSLMYKAGVGVAALTSFLLVWSNLAVGIIGSEDNWANLMFFAVPLIGLLGLALSRFSASGLAKTAFTMAAAQVLIPLIALAVARPQFDNDGPGSAGAAGIMAICIGFAMMFALSGILLRQSELPASRTN